jgi:uncharacterized repeat protein (TIGR03803 family)
VLYSFNEEQYGGDPGAGVVLDQAGNIYGTTELGGASGNGIVYKLDTSGVETVLYSFTGGADGGQPNNVVLDAAGNLYGTTFSGGDLSCNGGVGCGVVYELDTTGHYTLLHTFSGGADGARPVAGVILDPAGNLYGSTEEGGLSFGVVFKLDPAGNETVLYTFTGGADGGSPQAGVILDAAGNLYGTTYTGGDAACDSPVGCGVVFKLDPAGNETVLYSFKGGADGKLPEAGVVRGPAGELYGSTCFGGASNVGVVYKVDTTGNETELYAFTGGADGNTPLGVVLNSAGNLFGITNEGGKRLKGWPEGGGVIFEIVLH